jgi:BolA protein
MRQRRVNTLLAEELAGPVHALSIRAMTPDEAAS